MIKQLDIIKEELEKEKNNVDNNTLLLKMNLRLMH